MDNSKDRGWEFLTSDDFDGCDEDGSWGCNNDDGSASYYGADGSWGTKNSDGSASYYGADGSWGTKNTDGSGSYYGNDGSWGTINSDGSHSYYGADGSCDYKDADDDYDYSQNSSTSSDGGSLLGAAIGLGIIGAVALMAGKKSKNSNPNYEEDDKIEDNEEDSYESEFQSQEDLRRYAEKQQRQEKARIKKEEKKAFRKKHWKGILLAYLLIAVILFGAYKYWEYSKLIPVGVSSSSLINKDYKSVAQTLHDIGFTNIHTVALYDLNYQNKDDAGKVAQIAISNNTSFNAEEKYKYDEYIDVKYHSVTKVEMPFSAKEAKGEQYQDIIRQLEKAGFGNIVVDVDYDLITGWINKEGEIEIISIDGNDSFGKGDQFEVDKRIEVVYHDFKKNNPNR